MTAKSKTGTEPNVPISSPEQITFPEPSVVKAPPLDSPEQLAVAIVRPPPTNLIPLENVEVADVEVILRAFAVTPPAKVEVAVEVALIEATYGVVVETTFPEPSTERIVFGLTFDN